MKLVIGGATGFVGAETLRQAFSSQAITSIVTIGRRAAPVPDGADRSKLQEIILDDFLQYPDSAKKILADADACIWTIAVTPGKAATRNFDDVKKISADYAVAALNAMLASRTADTKMRFVYYSGMATERNQQRTSYMVPWPKYALMRGQAENDLLKGASESDGKAEVCVVKPGLILGPKFWFRGVASMALPSVKLENCAAAALKQCVEGIEMEPLENADLERIGAEYLAKEREQK